MSEKMIFSIPTILFIVQKLQVQIMIQNLRLRLIDASCEDKEGDTKEVHV